MWQTIQFGVACRGLYIAVLTILAPSVTALHLQLQAILGLWIQSVALNGLNYSLFGITVKTEKKETEAVKSSEPQPQPSIEEKQTETTDASATPQTPHKTAKPQAMQMRLKL
eukprot:34950_1